MKKLILFFIGIIAFTFFTKCKISNKSVAPKIDNNFLCNDFDTLKVNGTFIGGDLFYSNPYVKCQDTSICYSVFYVSVNDTIKLKKKEIEKSSIKIPLKTINYKMNTKVKLEIIYLKNYEPKLLHVKDY